MSFDLADIPLHEARVQAVRDETSWCVRLVIDVGDAAFMRSLTTPGQYVALAAPGTEARWFVVASRAADLPTVEFLIGRGSDVSDALASLRPGNTVRTSAPQGAGFAMPALAGRHVAFFASGTGIAAVRPVVESLLEADPTAALSVYYQERVRGAEPDGRTCEFALADELRRWEASGVAVHLACDARPDGAPAFVDTLYRHAPGRPPAAETAFVFCGNDALSEMLASLLAAEGVDPACVHRNY